jgi:hypothetical protein
VYVPETAVDKFAVSVACDDTAHFQRASEILRAAGAEDVREVGEEGA